MLRSRVASDVTYEAIQLRCSRIAGFYVTRFSFVFFVALGESAFGTIFDKIVLNRSGSVIKM